MVFHSIVREWCRTYRPMLDSVTNGNRRFYLTDSTAGVVEMAKGIVPKLSPFVMMESSVEGYADGGRIFRTYPIYFFVRARQMADGDAAAEAWEEAWYHCQNFLSWLRQRHDDDPTATGEYMRINMETGIDIQGVGPLEDGWYAVLIQLERLELLDLCPDDELYLTEPDQTDEPENQ